MTARNSFDDEFDGRDELDDEEWARGLDKLDERPDNPHTDEEQSANSGMQLLDKPDAAHTIPTATRATPSNLVEDKPWAYWGPLIDADRLNAEAIGLIARLTNQSVDEIANALLRVAHVPRYVLLERLSSTASAAVYSGIDVLLAREVAIKIHRDLRRHALRESQTMARLEHPNVVHIHDMGEHGSWMYSVIEYCEADLHGWHFDLGWAEILKRIIEAANGLAWLHENGFAHGDIKPANILIRGGTAKLADFGHVERPGARPSFIGNDGEELTVFGVGGTVGYVAPEVVKGGPGFPGDVFALAVTTWVCLFDEMPFPWPPGEVATVAATAERIKEHPPKEPSKIPPGLPSSVLPLLQRALDRDPTLRPSLDELTRGLRAAVEHRQQRRNARRHMLVRAAVVLGTLMFGFSIGAVRYRSSGAAGSVLGAAFRELDPMTRAEIAAGMGDWEQALAELNRAFAAARNMSETELQRATVRATRIAKILDEMAPDDAWMAWMFVDGLEELPYNR